MEHSQIHIDRIEKLEAERDDLTRRLAENEEHYTKVRDDLARRLADAERRAEDTEHKLNRYRGRLDDEVHKGMQLLERAEKAERKVDVRDVGWAGTRIAELKDERTKLEAKNAEQSEGHRKFYVSSQKQNAKLRAALEAACERLCEVLCHSGEYDNRHDPVCTQADRALKSDGSALDPSTPTKGCGVCPECAASDSDPERCTAGIGKERGE